jgi:glycosyltransferase involved in cell wall biosynthesis
MTAPRYSVIIPAYNEEAFLPATLAALRAAMGGVAERGELIVVDNHSTDRTAEVALAYGADRVVHEPVNQISRARNTGAKAAAPSSEFLIFVDADTLVPPLALRQALGHLAAGDTCGGGSVTVSDGRMPWFVGGFVTVWNAAALRLGMAAGCFVWCLRDGFQAVGGFDESVYAGEEVWFSQLLRRWGKQKGLRFRVLTSEPVVTSNRKSDWFPGWAFSLQLMLLMLCPWAARSRRLCPLWYRRP